MKVNKILGVMVLVLLAISVFSYRNSVSRASRFERGQTFLANLNPDEITEIIIVKGDETTHLRRDQDSYVLENAHGYTAKNESVNRFVRDVLEISLEKQVGQGEELERELELTGESAETIDVSFKDTADNLMVQFRVGKIFEDGGNYIRRVDSDDSKIYLTSKGVYFSTKSDEFIDKEIVNVQQTELMAINGPDYRIEEVDGALELSSIPQGKKEATTKLGQINSVLTLLRFDKQFLADDPEVSPLQFQAAITVELKDQSGYQLAVARNGDKNYMKIRGTHKIREVAVAPDDSEEVVKEKSELLARADEIREFNNFHGSWVYEVSEILADKLRLRKADLLE